MLIKTEIKKITKNRVTRIVLGIMMVLAIADPFIAKINAVKMNAVGNAFEYWALINPSTLTYTIFFPTFYIIPVILTGMVYIDESYTSIREMLIIREGRLRYGIEKIVSIAIVSFCFILLILLANVALTYLVFSSKADFYSTWMLPTVESLAKDLYSMNPLCLVLFYCFINAVFVMLMTLFVLGNWMVFRFPNKYIALAQPVVLLSVIGQLSDMARNYINYSTRILAQPVAAVAISKPITPKCFITTIGIWLLCDSILLLVGYIMNRNVRK